MSHRASRTASAVRYRRKSLPYYAATLCALMVLTACGSDDSDDAADGKLPGLEADASGPKPPGADTVPRGPRPPGTVPSGPRPPGTAPKAGADSDVWKNTQFTDFPHQALPLAKLKVADCKSYTAALADYGNHPSGGMVEGKGSIEFPGANDCTGWRTGDEQTIRDIKAGHMEYTVGFNCSPKYDNLDQMGDKVTQHLKDVSQATPGTTYSPMYRLSEFDMGFVFSVHRVGTNGSSGATATFLTEEGVCQAGFTAKRWAANDNGKGLKYVGLDEAETFKEFNLILNAMLGA